MDRDFTQNTLEGLVEEIETEKKSISAFMEERERTWSSREHTRYMTAIAEAGVVVGLTDGPFNDLLAEEEEEYDEQAARKQELYDIWDAVNEIDTSYGEKLGSLADEASFLAAQIDEITALLKGDNALATLSLPPEQFDVLCRPLEYKLDSGYNDAKLFDGLDDVTKDRLLRSVGSDDYFLTSDMTGVIYNGRIYYLPVAGEPVGDGVWGVVDTDTIALNKTDGAQFVVGWLGEPGFEDPNLPDNTYAGYYKIFNQDITQNNIKSTAGIYGVFGLAIVANFFNAWADATTQYKIHIELREGTSNQAVLLLTSSEYTDRFSDPLNKIVHSEYLEGCNKYPLDIIYGDARMESTYFAQVVIGPDGELLAKSLVYSGDKAVIKDYPLANIEEFVDVDEEFLIGNEKVTLDVTELALSGYGVLDDEFEELISDGFTK